MNAKVGIAFRKLFSHGLPYVMLSNVAQQGVAFLTVLFVAKFLPPSEFGLVRLALAYTAVATVLAAGGITAPILRYCADSALGNEQRRSLLAVGLRRTLVFALVVSLVAFGLVLSSREDTVQTSVFATYALQLPALAIASLLLVYLQAIQRFKTLAIYQVAIRFATLVVSVGAVYAYGLMGLLAATLVMAYLVCVPLLALSRPQFRPPQKVCVPTDFSSLAFYSVFGTAVTALGQYADMIILDLTGTPRADIAVYALATVFFFAALGVGGAVQSVATPMFTSLMHEPAVFRQQLLRWSVRLGIAAIPVAMTLVSVAWLVETRFLDNNYAGLSKLLAILMLKFLLWSTYAVGGAALVGVGAIKQGAGIAVLTTMVTIAIGFPLCERYGVYGAAWTQVIASLLSAIVIWWVLVVETRSLRQRSALPPARDA
ncbi:oligosaccharide flippase family protein [Hydrogenophaga sp.]|uniref:oligosaccharide flippase family protein n=1 Tax=Hydrogenophaga sp. TaxID=1904254 RepID=UPI003AF93FB4